MITRIRSQGNPTRPIPGKTPDRSILDLKRGDVIRGEIVRDYGKGDILIQSGGSAFRAFAKLNVREGEQYDFRVKVEAGKNSPAVLERVGTNPSMQNLPSLLSKVTSVLSMRGLSSRTSAIVRTLAHAIPAHVYNGPVGDPVSWLTRFVADGGLFWESKVARSLQQGIRSDWKRRLGNDLKGMLLNLRKSLEAEKQTLPGIDSAAKEVDEALELIQKNQWENRDLLRAEGCWFLFVPGKPEEGFKGAELLVRRNKEEKEIRFSMSMDLTHLGPMQVSASILNSVITVRFEVSDEKRAELVRMSLPVLEGGLRDKGLTPGQLACVVREAESVEEEALRRRGRPSDSINLVI